MTKHAITRAVGQSLASCELTYFARAPIDLDRAAEQHAAYCAALTAAGISLTIMPAEDEFPDAVFIEDTAIVLDEIAVITRPGAESRRGEAALSAAALEGYRNQVQLQAPATLDGGDVLRVGRRFFVGLSSRTNQAGVEQFTSAVQKFGYSVTPVRVSNCLHLKSAVTALNHESVLLNPDLFDSSVLNGIQKVRVSETEPFASNVLNLDGVIHLSSSFPRTREILDNHGFYTHAIEFSEFEKAEAALTCLSLIFYLGVGRGLPARVTRYSARLTAAAAGQ